MIDRETIAVDLDIGVIESTDTSHGSEVLNLSVESYKDDLKTYVIHCTIFLHEDNHMLDVAKGTSFRRLTP